MSDSHYVNGAVVLTCTLEDDDGDPVAGTGVLARVRRRGDSGSWTTLSVSEPTTGTLEALFKPTAAGIYDYQFYRVASSPEIVEPGWFEVLEPPQGAPS